MERRTPKAADQNGAHLVDPKSAKRTAGLREVASLAGVSVTTASRALSTPELVSDSTMLRIQAAIHKLGYLPNSAARALRSRRTKLIGAIVTTLDHAICASLVETLQAKLHARGYSLVVTSSEFDPRVELEQARVLVERGVEALVLLGDHHRPELYELLARTQIPFINTYAFKPERPYSCVGFDNAVAGEKIASHLVQLGHQEIAMIAGIQKENDRASDRVLGVKRELSRSGLNLRSGLFCEKPYSIEAGREGFRQLLRTDFPFTAIICGSDVLAFGVLAECRALKIKVPEKLSITGFDDLEFAAHLSPPLTTIRVPAEEMGSRAAEYAIRCLESEISVQHIHLEATLILRATTAPPSISK
jgi:LacI family transcriptional regulator